jgi:hypothetical protein
MLKGLVRSHCELQQVLSFFVRYVASFSTMYFETATTCDEVVLAGVKRSKRNGKNGKNSETKRNEKKIKGKETKRKQ